MVSFKRTRNLRVKISGNTIINNNVKGNPNFQDIKLNTTNIALLLLEATQNMKKSRFIEQNLVLFLPFSLFIATCTSCRLLQRRGLIISWTIYSANFKHEVVIRAVYSFVFWFENGFLQVKPSRYHCLHKKTVYSNFCTNLAWIRNSWKFFNHIQKQLAGVFHKKLFLKILWYSQENACVGVPFTLNLQTFRSLNVLKRDFNRYFLVTIRKFKKTLGCFRIFGNCFERKFFRS